VLHRWQEQLPQVNAVLLATTRTHDGVKVLKGRCRHILILEQGDVIASQLGDMIFPAPMASLKVKEPRIGVPFHQESDVRMLPHQSPL